MAQLIAEACCIPDIVEVDSLPTTARGTSGFGSTGPQWAPLDTSRVQDMIGCVFWSPG